MQRCSCSASHTPASLRVSAEGPSSGRSRMGGGEGCVGARRGPLRAGHARPAGPQPRPRAPERRRLLEGAVGLHRRRAGAHAPAARARRERVRCARPAPGAAAAPGRSARVPQLPWGPEPPSCVTAACVRARGGPGLRRGDLAFARERGAARARPLADLPVALACAPAPAGGGARGAARGARRASPARSPARGSRRRRSSPRAQGRIPWGAAGAWGSSGHPGAAGVPQGAAAWPAGAAQARVAAPAPRRGARCRRGRGTCNQASRSPRPSD
jgi:hypothetical protein